MASKWILITGTGTDVGKTYYASALAKTRRLAGQRVGVYKPVASGCQPDEQGRPVAGDAVSLWRAAGEPLSLPSVCPQTFVAALAPPEAAAAEGRRVNEDQLIAGLDVWNGFDEVLIEGAGGLFSPISDSMLNLDFAIRLQSRYPLEIVLVASDRLGVQHDVIACTRAAEAAGLTIHEVVLNAVTPDASTATNATNLSKWISVAIRSFPKPNIPSRKQSNANRRTDRS